MDVKHSGWMDAAILLVGAIGALTAVNHLGLHREYVLRHGTAVTANLQAVRIPAKGRPFSKGRSHEPEADVQYQRAPGFAPTVTVPVSREFFERYAGRKPTEIAIHFLPGSALPRVIIDEEPPLGGWRWPLAIIIAAVAAACVVRGTRRP